MRPLRLRKTAITTAAVTAAVLVLGACSGATGDGKAAGETRTVETADGKVDVPFKPVRVAALDNTSFATLKAFGVTPVAAPKSLLPKTGYEDWAKDEKVADAGGHREPLFEAVNESEPDLIIGGYRFAEHTDKLNKIAKTIDVSPDDEAEGGYVASLKKQTRTLGAIFGQEEKAEELVAALDASTEAAGRATNGESVFLGVASAGKIDNGASRIGRLMAPLSLKNVLDPAGQDSTSVHNNSGLAPETIAQLNPDWMILFDRDAAVGKGDTTPAKVLVDGQQAWAKTTFRTKDQIVHLAPDFYVTEGIQAYTEAFGQVAEAFTAKS